MKLILKDTAPVAIACDALIIPLFDNTTAQELASLHTLPGDTVASMLSRGELSAKANAVTVLHTLGSMRPLRLIFVGLGSRPRLEADTLRQAAGMACKAARSSSARSCAVTLQHLQLEHSLTDAADFVEGALLSQYEFNRYKKPEDDAKPPVESLTILAPKAEHAALKKRIALKEAVAEGVCFARDLVSTPARDLTPTDLVSAARSIKGTTVKVIEKKEAQRLGMNSFLSVSEGSLEPPKFIIITYRGAAKASKLQPIVLVGKSITFDSGGLSLKPPQSMEQMKYDMAGGAAVLGTIMALVRLGLPVDVTGVLPATENLPGNRANKPGDVVRSITGTTIEILNTDAEGRLALADALGYAVKHLKAREIIDLATLTGACSVALGETAMAMFSTSDDLSARLECASRSTGERLWRMPLFEEYAEYLKSPIADLQNISNTRSGGLVTSGCFLRQFVDDTPWAHFDIAGTAWTDKDRPYTPKGATGVGVRTLVQYLVDRS